LLATTGCAATPNNHGCKDAIVTVRVVNDEGEPVSDVRSRLLSLSWYDAPAGLTDTNGIFQIELKSIYAEINGYFSKLGHYETKGTIWKWKQWGEVPPADTNFTVVLKRMIEPMQMKKRVITVYASQLCESVGFDFEIGDLVFPEGKGQNADMIITTSREYISENNFTSFVNMEFPGEQNGIQSFSFDNNFPVYYLRSDLPPPPIAPESGYDKILDRFSKCSPPSERSQMLPRTHSASNKNIWTASYVEGRKWIFRVRTEVDENWNVITANYGWTTSEIRVVAKPDSDGKVLGLEFTYYYNSDPKSRSLEPKEIADRQNKN
jgi:hypothetical protein